MGKIRSIIRKVQNKFEKKREHHLIKKEIGRKVELSVADLIRCNSRNGELFRYDIVVRYLAVSEYQNGSDRGFALYREMQEKRKGAGFSVDAEERFKALIKSYDETGYDKESRILLDRNLRLIDGSHRIAMALYYGYKNISALIIDSEHPVSYSIDWFVETGFSPEDIEWVISTGKKLINSVMAPFSCVIWAPAASLAVSIVKDLSFFGEVQSVKKYTYRPDEYKNVVRAIYAIDDIEKWKIEKKIDYMEPHGTSIIAVDLSITNPAYRIKTSSGLPLSTVGEGIKRSVRSKYKSKIDNYFFDIVLHIGDNIYQSEYMREVLDSKIDFVEMVSILNQYNYAFVKIDVPYMPLDFPEHIPIGKDADILCSSEDVQDLIKEVIEMCRKYKDYNIVVIHEAAGTRLRIQWGRVLVYQVDIAYEIQGLESSFVEDALSTRQQHGMYYTLDPRYEYIYRVNTFRKNMSKSYHKDYLKEHMKDFDYDLLKKYCDCEVEDLIR